MTSRCSASWRSLGTIAGSWVGVQEKYIRTPTYICAPNAIELTIRKSAPFAWFKIVLPVLWGHYHFPVYLSVATGRWERSLRIVLLFQLCDGTASVTRINYCLVHGIQLSPTFNKTRARNMFALASTLLVLGLVLRLVCLRKCGRFTSQNRSSTDDHPEPWTRVAGHRGSTSEGGSARRTAI
jgi:hypothetical protein